MKAMVLVDNMEGNGLKGEWGLSIYIEHKDKSLLLDTGASDLFLENALKMGINIYDTDIAVLSHAHYDHSNGMRVFFSMNEKADFYIQESCGENCYKKKRIFRKYIGMPRGIIATNKDRIKRVSGDAEIADGLWLIPHKTKGLESLGRREEMYVKEKDGWHFDDFSHEQSLVIEADKGLVIFNSCCHGGAAAIINEVIETFSDKNVYGLIGGFHLFNKSEGEIREFANRVRNTGIEYICTGHCTGERAYGILAEELGNTMHHLKTGLVMEF